MRPEECAISKRARKRIHPPKSSQKHSLPAKESWKVKALVVYMVEGWPSTQSQHL
jgi:hypothetical protein